MKIFTIFLVLLLSLATANVFAKPVFQRVHFTSAELADIQGHYSSVAGYIYISVKGKQVSTNLDGKYIQLIKKSDGHFYPSYKFLRIFPISLGNMSFSLKTIKGSKQILMHEKDSKGKPKKVKTVAQKFAPKTIPQLWNNRIGKYKATLLTGKSNIKSIRLAKKNGVLVAFINKIKSPYPLLALSPSRLFSPSAGHNKAQKIKLSTRDNIIYLSYGKNRFVLKKL